MKQGVIQAGLWAVFPHVGAYDTLWQTWNLAYKAWLPNSTAQLRDAPPFEVYLSNKRTTSPEKLRTEIYLPVTFP
jgi:AraC family transcriptional regulator